MLGSTGTTVPLSFSTRSRDWRPVHALFHDASSNPVCHILLPSNCDWKRRIPVSSLKLTGSPHMHTCILHQCVPARAFTLLLVQLHPHSLQLLQATDTKAGWEHLAVKHAPGRAIEPPHTSPQTSVLAIPGPRSRDQPTGHLTWQSLNLRVPEPSPSSPCLLWRGAIASPVTHCIHTSIIVLSDISCRSRWGTFSCSFVPNATLLADCQVAVDCKTTAAFLRGKLRTQSPNELIMEIS